MIKKINNKIKGKKEIKNKIKKRRYNKYQNKKGIRGTFKKRKVNIKLRNYYFLKMSLKKRVKKINNFFKYKMAYSFKWGHTHNYKIQYNKVKIKGKGRLLIKNKLNNIKRFIVMKGLIYNNLVNLKNRLKNEVLQNYSILKLRKKLYLKKLTLNNKKVTRKHTLLFANKIKKQLKSKKPIYLIAEENLPIKNLSLKKTTKNIYNNLKSLKLYNKKNHALHFLNYNYKKNKEIQDKVQEVPLINIPESIFMSMKNIISKIELNKNKLTIKQFEFLNKKYNINKKINKIKELSLNKLKDKKNKQLQLRKGIKILLKIKLLLNLYLNKKITNDLNIDNINASLKLEKSNLINNVEIADSIKKKLNKKNRRKINSKRNFTIARMALYGGWNQKVYRKKRLNKILTIRGLKRLQDLVKNLKSYGNLTGKIRKSNKKLEIYLKKSKLKKKTLISELRQIQANAFYYMSQKIKRRQKIKATGIKKIKGKKQRKKKNIQVLKKVSKRLYVDNLKLEAAQEKETAKIKAIITKHKTELKNEIIIKLLLQMLKSKGEDTVDNRSRSITEIKKYLLKTKDMFENSNLITNIKAQLIQGFLEKRDLTKLQLLNKVLIFHMREFQKVQIPKKRLPEKEFKTLIKSHYHEKNKLKEIRKEMKKNLIHYYLFEENIKENNTMYKINLPKKRIIVPTLKTIYKSLKKAIKVQKRKEKIKKYGKRYFKRKYKKKQRYNKKEQEKIKLQREKRRKKKQMLKLKRKKIEIPKIGILKIKLKKRNMFLTLCNRTTNRMEEQVTAREVYYKISESRNDVQPSEKGKRIDRKKGAIKDKGPISRYISTMHFRLFVLSLLLTFRAKYRILDVEIEKKSRNKIIKVIRNKRWYPFLTQRGVFRKFKFIKNKPHGRMRKRKTKRR